MIPKIIHFIWLGNLDRIPSYAEWSINNFKMMNPTFEVWFHKLSAEELFDKIKKYDDNIMKIIEPGIDIFMTNLIEIKKQIIEQKPVDIKTLFTSMYATMTDTYRRQLLNIYGGIYCDLDCFPLKPFDDELLKNNAFQMKNILGFQDIFFMGCRKGVCFDHDTEVNHIENTFSINDKKVFNDLHEKFKNQSLIFSDEQILQEHRNKYIYHFEMCESLK